MCVGVCLETLEVHLRNTCQGSSVIASVKSGRERETSGQEEGKRGDRWRNIMGGESYKKRRKEGWGEFGWGERSRGEGLKLSRGGCEKALPVGFRPSDRNLGLCPPNMPPLCLVHLSFCL